MDELKKNQVENSDKNLKDALQCGLTVSLTPLPPLLQALSDDEREKLEKHLVRKLDLRLMPMLVLIYIMNYLDRYECPPCNSRLPLISQLQKCDFGRETCWGYRRTQPNFCPVPGA